ncbi:MAG: TOBE-like domain-containing protein, partial [Thermoguttaceae bacterium]|nr:TOBE-like domain-containing protein [Thermoguttaceae bacterium]
EIHLTSVFVTHDQDEALELADRVAVMNNGRIEQFDTPDNVFHQPATAFVMNFLGQVNQFRGRMAGEGQVRIGRHRGRAAEMVLSRSNWTDNGAAAIFVRPHDLEIVRKPIEGRLCLPATIERIHSAGAHVRVDLISENNENLVAEISHYDRERLRLEQGDSCYVTPTSIRVFDLVEEDDLLEEEVL